MAKPKEECGVFGVYGVDGASKAVYYGLFALQHRGQESCGIVSNQNRELFCHKDMGLVNEVFTDDILATLLGDMAIGHVRYSTTGQSVRANAQPLVTKYVKGTLAISHNGNLSNGAALREKFEHEGFMFQTTIDSEVIAYNIAKERKKTKSVEQAVLSAMKDFKGAYSLLVMSPEKLIAARDPYGFRPLCIGTLGDGYVFASESCALDAVGAAFLRDVEPGEVVVATKDGLVSLRDNMTSSSARCIFEYIYFAARTAVLTAFRFMRRGLRRGAPWQSATRWRPIWLSACRIRASTRPSAIPSSRGSPTARAL